MLMREETSRQVWEQRHRKVENMAWVSRLFCRDFSSLHGDSVSVSAPLRHFENATGPAEAGSLLPLFVPATEGLGEVLGYRGDARFIGMFWSDDANEVIVTDGCARGVGESLRFLEYRDDPKAAVEGFDQGFDPLLAQLRADLNEFVGPGEGE